MKRLKKNGTRGHRKQHPRTFMTPEAKHFAECTAALSSFLRSSRRCGKALGLGCVPGLVELLLTELGGKRG